MDIQKIDEYIDKVYWKEAKSYRDKAPHEYTIRDWRKDLEPTFLEFVQFIRRTGRQEKFFSRTFTYFYHGKYKYWTMGDPLDVTVVLNRCLIEEYPNNIYRGKKS